MICSLKFKQEVILKMLLWVLCFWFWSYAQIQVEDDVCSVASPTCQTFQIQAKISTVRPILQTIFPFLMTMLQAILTCQFCMLWVRAAIWQLFTNKLSWIQFALFFPYCEHSQASKMKLCAKMFHSLKASTTVQLAKLASMMKLPI